MVGKEEELSLVSCLMLSTVLPEASQYSASNEYLTLKEKIHKVSLFMIKSKIIISGTSLCD